jgi:hypothetical protein
MSMSIYVRYAWVCKSKGFDLTSSQLIPSRIWDPSES